MTTSFEEMEDKMTEFSSLFKSTLQNYKSNLYNSKAEYQLTLEEFIQKKQEIKQKKLELENNELKIRQDLANEVNKLNDSKLKIEELKNNENNLLITENNLKDRLNVLNSQISQKNLQLSKTKESFQKNIKEDLNLVKLYENFLGLKINSLNDDIIKFQFFNLFQNNLDQTFEIILDLSDSKGLYKIKSLSYPLPNNEIDKYIDQLNNDRNLSFFLKNMRNLFINNFIS